MAEFGNAAALDYRMDFPQQQGQYAPPPVAQQQQVDVPQYDKDPIAVRGKLTSDYYNNMGLLRSFAQDMAKKGIDPFTPDYSQDGGGLAFQTMQKLQAGLLYAANALGNEFKAEQQLRPLIAQGAVRPEQGVDLNEGMAYSDPKNFYATSLDPIVTQANQVLGDARYTQGDSNKLNQTVRDPRIQYFQQQIQKDPNNATYYQRQIDALLTNSPQTAYQQLIPRGGISHEDLSRRAQLIKQIKGGILTNDQTPINMLKLVPGVEDVGYVNTGDRVGLEVYYKGQPNPSFIDLSKGAGEGDINALLNRIEGQKNVPNESVFSFDTKVSIPPSNAKQVLEDFKPKFKALGEDVMPKFQELASSGKLSLPDGAPIKFAEIDPPSWFFGAGGKDLVITYNPVVKGKVDYTKTKTKKIDQGSDELDEIVNYNANKIAPAFGGGFKSGKSIKSSDIPAKAAAAGYTPEEYTQLLQQKGIQIVE